MRQHAVNNEVQANNTSKLDNQAPHMEIGSGVSITAMFALISRRAKVTMIAYARHMGADVRLSSCHAATSWAKYAGSFQRTSSLDCGG